MSTTALNIEWTAAATGKKASTKINYVNPDANSDSLQTLAQSLNNLTTNTYSEATRIDTTNVDSESPTPLAKNLREITITGAARGATATITFNATSSITNNPVVFFITPSGTSYTATYLDVTSGTTTQTQRTATVTVPSSGGYLYAGLRENAVFYADFVMAEVS